MAETTQITGDWTNYYKAVLANPTATPQAIAEAKQNLGISNPITPPTTTTPTPTFPTVNQYNAPTGTNSASIATSKTIADLQLEQYNADKAAADALRSKVATAPTSYADILKQTGMQSTADYTNNQYNNPEYLSALNKRKADNAALEALNTDLNDTLAQRDKQIAAITGIAGQSADFMNNQISQINRNANVVINQKQGNINVKLATIAADNQDLATAENHIKQAVDNYTFELNQNIKLFQDFQQQNRELLASLDAQTRSDFNNYLGTLKNQEEQQRNDLTTVLELQIKYPGSGIVPTDSVIQATAKASRLAGYNVVANSSTLNPYNTPQNANQSVLNDSFSYAVTNFTKDQRNNATVTYNGFIARGDTIGAERYVEKLLTDKLSTTQKDAITTMGTVESQISKILSYNSDGKLEGVGFVSGPLGALATKVFGTGSKEAQDVRALIGNIKGTIAKLRGGTSFTPNEEKLLESYTPGINESATSVLNKLGLLQTFIQEQRNKTLYPFGNSPTTSSNQVQDLRTKYNY